MLLFRENPLLFFVFGLTLIIVMYKVWLLSFCKYSFRHTASWKGSPGYLLLQNSPPEQLYA